MSLDMHVRSVPVIRAEIWLRVDAFERATTLVGRTTSVARAELVDVSERQVSRARSGRVGEQFVAKVLVGLRRAGLKVTFEELFEVRELGGDQ